MRLETRPARYGLAIALAIALSASTAPSGWAQDPDEPSDHTISVPEQDAATLGDTRALSLTLTPRPGYSISLDGPLVIELGATPKDGLALPRQRYARRHAADPRAATPRFDLAYRAAKAGRYTMTISLRFWVCRKQTCRPIRATRRVHIDISQPAAKNHGNP